MGKKCGHLMNKAAKNTAMRLIGSASGCCAGSLREQIRAKQKLIKELYGEQQTAEQKENKPDDPRTAPWSAL